MVTYFYLPNRPESTTYLTERERKIAVARMNRGTSGDIGAVVNRGKHLSDRRLRYPMLTQYQLML